MNLIFDLGNVLVEWNPQKFIAEFNITDAQKLLITQHLFEHDDWLMLDKGTKTENQVIVDVVKRTGMSAELIEDLINKTLQSLLVIERTARLLPQLKAAGHQLYCLSNMSVGTYEFIKHFDFFEYFDDIIISAHIKMIKPDLEIFEFTRKQFNLGRADSLFIDDREENIQAAKKVGIDGLLFDHSDSVYKKIAALT